MTPHCRGCTLHHVAGHPANSPHRRYNDWCCATGKPAKKAVGECKLKGLKPVEQTMGDSIEKLRAAVERAENPPADYNEWTARHSGQTVSPYELWTAAQQAERMRIKDLLRQSSDWFEDDQMAQANWLLEKIDATTE